MFSPESLHELHTEDTKEECPQIQILLRILSMSFSSSLFFSSQRLELRIFCSATNKNCLRFNGQTND